MLASLLPGIRELRTPLVAGYLWLLEAWLLLSPHVGSHDLPAQLRMLAPGGTTWDPVAFGAAVSFLALVLGVIAEGLYDSTTSAVLRRALPDDPVSGLLGWHALQARLASGLTRLRSGPTKSGVRSLNFAAREVVREAEQQLAGPEDLRDLVLMLGFVRGRRDRPPTDNERADLRNQLDLVHPDQVRESLAAWLVIRILDQLELLARRLVTDNPALFSDYNRLKTEAEFRTAIAMPLVALTITLAADWSPWVACCLLGAPILVRQAIRKGDQASDLLIDALLIDRVKAPAFEQLTRATDELLSEREGRGRGARLETT